ncbi:MAG: prefoldin subunit alpha [Euryarchaeota archaeon RBG_16_62_10]|nr:MAG: prefoldin subunit alpha [Euryarchaeota archaeon RBG_16_62_10]
MTEQPLVDERQLREDYATLEAAKAQLDGLAKQQQLVQLAIDEHVRARETIKDLTKGAAGDDSLVPIGADSYIHAKVSDNRHAIVGVGSAVSIRRSPEEAEKVLDSRIDDLSRAFKSLADRATQTEMMIQDLSEKVQAQIEQLQAAEKS